MVRENSHMRNYHDKCSASLCHMDLNVWNKPPWTDAVWFYSYLIKYLCFKKKEFVQFIWPSLALIFILLHQTQIRIIRTILTTANLFSSGKKKKNKLTYNFQWGACHPANSLSFKMNPLTNGFLFHSQAVTTKISIPYRESIPNHSS